MKANPIDVSIVIVSWNTREILRDCLRSVYDHAGDVRAEVIVVDNASSDGSSEMVEAEYPQARLIRNGDNRGFAAANNQGMVAAEGRYYLLLNSDTVVTDSAIAMSVAFADAHPDAGLVGCRTVFGDGRLQRNCYMFPSLLNLSLALTKLNKAFRRTRFFGRQRLSWWDYNSARTVDAIAGCFMLARREAVEQAGLMDETYFMYSEDTDWCWRFGRQGWKTMYTPDALIVHLRGASSSQCEADMGVYARRSLLMFFERKSGKPARWMANGMYLAASLARVSYLALTRMFGSGKGEDPQGKFELAVATLRYHSLGRLPVSPQSKLREDGMTISSQLKRIIKLVVSAGYWPASGIVGVVRRAFGGGGQPTGVVLYYHGVSKAELPSFRWQMEYLKQRSRVVRVSEMVMMSSPGRTVCVTFDDGLDNVRTNALGVLGELDLPAMIFAVSGNLGRIPAWEMPVGHPDADVPLMTGKHLKALPRSTIEIGSHTVTHADLSALDISDVRREISESRLELEALLGTDIGMLSVPYGTFNADTLRVAREAGYEHVLTSEPRVYSGCGGAFEIGRFKVSPHDWRIEFRLKVAGAYGWLPSGCRTSRHWKGDPRRRSSACEGSRNTQNHCETPLEPARAVSR